MAMEAGRPYLNLLVFIHLSLTLSHMHMYFTENVVQHIFLAGLNRCGKSCRLRWANYLRPDIKRGKFSQEEEQTILQLHSILGNKY